MPIIKDFSSLTKSIEKRIIIKLKIVANIKTIISLFCNQVLDQREGVGVDELN